MESERLRSANVWIYGLQAERKDEVDQDYWRYRSREIGTHSCVLGLMYLQMTGGEDRCRN